MTRTLEEMTKVCMETVVGRLLVRLLEQSPTDWVAYKQQPLISHRSGGWTSEIGALAWSGSGENPLPVADCQTSPCVHTWPKEGEGALWGPFYRGTNPLREALPS